MFDWVLNKPLVARMSFLGKNKYGFHYNLRNYLVLGKVFRNFKYLVCIF